MIPALLTVLLWSYCIIPARQLVLQLGENWANILRLILSALVLGAMCHLWGQGFAGGAFSIFFLSGILGFGLGDIGMIYALPRIGSRLTLLMAQCVAAPIAGLVEWLWMGTVIHWVQLLAMALILGGVWIALLPGHLEIEAKKRFTTGILFGLLAAFGQGMGAVLSRRGYLEMEQIAVEANSAMAERGVWDSIILGASTGYFRLLGGILIAGVFMVIAYWYRPWRSVPKGPEQYDSFGKKGKNLLLTSMAGPMFGIVCFQWALATTPSGIVQAIVSMTPLVILPMAWYFEGERPTRRSILGSGIAVVGVLLMGL